MELTIYLVPGPHLLPLLHERLVPYFELHEAEEETGSEPPPEAAGFLTRTGRKVVRIFRTMVDRFPLHERLCIALAKADSVRICYPNTISAEEAGNAFHHFLIFQRSKHRFWTGVNGVLAGLGTLLMPIPGPNIFFFYPAVRAYSHFRARNGAGKGRHMKVTLQAHQRLGRFRDEIHSLPRREIMPLVEQLAADMELRQLPDFYRKCVLHKHASPEGEESAF